MDSRIEKLPPHSIAAERCTLASAMLSGDALSEIRAILGAEAFYQPDHQIIWTAMVRMADAGKPIDAVLLRAELQSMGQLEEVGGTAHIAEILQTVPSAAHGAYYAQIVREKWVWREGIRLANSLIRAAYADHQEDGSSSRAVMEAAASLSALGAGSSGEKFRHLSEMVHDVMEAISTGHQHHQFIPTGFRDIDAAVGGLRRGGFTMVGGRPGMGKSQFLKAIGMNAARLGFVVCHITIEEDLNKVATNILSTLSGVENRRLAVGSNLSEHDYRLIGETQTRIIPEMQFYGDDSPTKLSEVISSIYAAKAKYNADLVTVDYLQLINPEIRGPSNGDRDITQISNGLKLAFKQTKVAGCVAVQLNRGNETERIPPPPTLRNLRGSGSLEQDGDLILMLHSEDYYRRQLGEQFAPDHQLKVILAKHKSGPGGTIPLFQDHRNQCLRDWSPTDGPTGGDDVPDFH